MNRSSRLICPLPECSALIIRNQDTMPLYKCMRGHVTNYPVVDVEEARRERVQEVMPHSIEMTAKDD